jgi:hypothetical protein
MTTTLISRGPKFTVPGFGTPELHAGDSAQLFAKKWSVAHGQPKVEIVVTSVKTEDIPTRAGLGLVRIVRRRKNYKDGTPRYKVQYLYNN